MDEIVPATPNELNCCNLQLLCNKKYVKMEGILGEGSMMDSICEMCFIAIGQHLMKSNELLAAGSGGLDPTGERSGLGLSEDLQRAIVETAQNTRKLAERSGGRGLVFT